jgi:tetratricopeptide (TPR) repeat protein
MKRILFLITIVSGCIFNSFGQKSKVISLSQLIETGKYTEAKTAVEEAIVDNKTSEWSRTWYARGLLCQTAYREGMKKKDKKMYELYPDQLYVAYESYEKALALDKRDRIEKQIAPQYVLLVNAFQELGEQHFKSKKFEEALKAYEHALQINEKPFLSVQIDTNLIYNAALAAYESEDWNKATEYLEKLHEANYSSNVAHLLFSIYLEKQDTVAAEKIMLESIERYDDKEELVLLLVDLLYDRSDYERAVAILDTVNAWNSAQYIYPFTKGLVYQKIEQYRKAIEAYTAALELAPDELKIYINIGTCYFNLGVEIEERARTITNNRLYREEKEKSTLEFRSAVEWFEKANEKDSDNQEVITKLYELYKILGITDKIRELEQ